MIRWTGLAPWVFESPFPGSLTSTFLGFLREADLENFLQDEVTNSPVLSARIWPWLSYMCPDFLIYALTVLNVPLEPPTGSYARRTWRTSCRTRSPTRPCCRPSKRPSRPSTSARRCAPTRDRLHGGVFDTPLLVLDTPGRVLDTPNSWTWRTSCRTRSPTRPSSRPSKPPSRPSTSARRCVQHSPIRVRHTRASVRHTRHPFVGIGHTRARVRHPQLAGALDPRGVLPDLLRLYGGVSSTPLCVLGVFETPL